MEAGLIGRRRFAQAGMLSGLAAAAAGLLPSSSARAQNYPSRPIRLVVPYAPGGVVDGVGRAMADALGAELRQTVVVDNRPGGSAVVGSDFVAKSPPDGYTLLVGDAALVVNPVLRADVPFDVFRDLRSIAIVSSSPFVLAVSPSLPVRSVQEFIAYGRSRPGGLTYASPGTGSPTHLAAQLFCSQLGIEGTAVPYRAVAPSLPDIAAGRVDFIFSSLTGAQALVLDGQLKGLATTGAERSPSLPALPTMIEAGVPGFVTEIWLGLFAPAGLPEEVTARLWAAVQAALRNPETVALFQRTGNSARTTTPEEAAAFVRAEHERWRAVIQATPASSR